MVIGRRSVHGVTARPRVAGEEELILGTVLTQTLASMVNIVQDLMWRHKCVTTSTVQVMPFIRLILFDYETSILICKPRIQI
jgi:hypothetical protein